MFAPPRYLASPFSGIDLSTSSVKAVRLDEGISGLTLVSFVAARLPAGAYTNGEIINPVAVTEVLADIARSTDISAANVALPESFEKHHIDALLSVFDAAHIPVRMLEKETISLARALLHRGDRSTVLIIDIGKTTTKMVIVAKGDPIFTATIGIGGHALTLTVQKYFGVTETEARKVKAERGIVPTIGNEDYLAAMLSTVSAIRDEIFRQFEYWQGKALPNGGYEPISHAILVGGNASVRGLPEYLEGTLKIPVAVGDVFTNLSSRDIWVPQMDCTESLAYATAIGLALYDNEPYA